MQPAGGLLPAHHSVSGRRREALVRSFAAATPCLCFTSLIMNKHSI